MAVTGAGNTARGLIGTSDGRLLIWSASARDWTTVALPEPRTNVDSIQCVRDQVLILSGGRLFELGPAPSIELIEITSPVEGLRGLAWNDLGDQLFFLGSGEIAIQEGSEDARHWIDYEVSQLPGHRQRFMAVATAEPCLYFGNEAMGFCVSENDGVRPLDILAGLLAPGVNALLGDREGNVWVASERGLSKIANRRFDSYTRDHGLFQSEVTAVLESHDGTMVLGHPDGLTIMEDPPRHLVFSPGTGAGRVLDLDQAADGTLWVSAAWHGLVEIRPGGEILVHGRDQGLEVPVSSVLLGDDGPEWIATAEGVFRMSADGFEEVVELRPSGQGAFFMRNLTRGANGRCYSGTGTHGALSWGRDLIPRLAVGEPGSLAMSTFGIRPAADGQVWVASSAGLMVMDDRTLIPCTNPRIDRPVYFIEPGVDGTTWFGTNNGAYRWDGEQLRHFTIQHGLAGAETNRGAGLVDSHGRFWIGTGRGASVYNPARDIPRPHPPTVEILTCDVPRAGPSNSSDESDRSHSQNQLTFRYRAIAFTDETRVRFETFLDGHDQAWSAPHLSPLRQTSYGYLPPGDYTFRIRAIDVEGQKSDTAEWATIRIRQPFWNETWFRALAALVSIGVLFTTSSMVVHRRNSSRFEHEVSVRTRELSDSQAATERERIQLELTLANIGDGVAAIGRNGEVLIWNRAAHRATGWSPEEAIGRPLTELLGDRALTPVQGPRAASVVTLRTGESRQFDIASAETPAQGDLAAARVVVFRDVTDRLALDRELVREEKLEALGLLAGGIAHDFNNLLTVIIGNLSLPLPPALDSGLLAESLQDANAAANRARLLTLQLLTFSKGGAPVRQAASIATILHETSSFMFSGANVLCTIDVADDLRLVEIDEGQMGQVFHNLMINAREAMPNGGTVRVRARNVSDVPPFLTKGDYIVIEFEDEGVGVSESDLAHIFDPYFSTKARGSGLGLAIAYSVVQRHGGHVTVDSVIGKGTTFRVYLEASAQQLPDRPYREITPRPKAGARVLVMDDEEPILRLVTSILTDAGHSVSCVRTGEVAIEHYGRAMTSGNPFDAVIMDLTIPGAMGGREAIQRLKELDPSVRAIVASGYSNDPVMARAQEFGFCAGVSKPFGVEQLVRVLEQVLARGSSPWLEVK